MKKFILILAVLSLLLSCTKEFSGSYNEEAPRVEKVLGNVCPDGCPVCDLVHHTAKEPSYAESGNKEFWQCPHCKAVYSDPNAEKRFEGLVYILPTRIIQGEDNLRILAGDYSGGTKGPISKIFVDYAIETALAATVASLVVGVTSLAVSIEEMSTNNDEIEEALTKMSGKIDKTAEEIAVLKQKTIELQKSVFQTSELMSAITIQVDSLYTYMDSLVEYSRSVEKKVDIIFEQIESMDEDFHYRKLLDDRHHDLVTVTDPCVGAINAIKDGLKRDMTYFESAEDYSDSLSVIRLCLMDVNNVISAWGSDKGNYAAMTCNLIQSYSKMSNNPWDTFPSVLESYINNHIIWEHQGYWWRVKSLITDFVISSSSYLLASTYFRNCTGWDRNYADLKCSSLNENYGNMVSLYEAGIDKINRGDSLYRRCLINDKTFDSHLLSDAEAVAEYFSYLEKEYGSANVIEEFDKHQDVFYRGDETSCFTFEDWEYMQAASYAEDKNFGNVLYTYDEGGMGFRTNMDTEKYLWCMIFPYSEKGTMSVGPDAKDPQKTWISFYCSNCYGTPDYETTAYMTTDGVTTTITYQTRYSTGMIFPYYEKEL